MNVSAHDVDADFIVDCTGKPVTYDSHHQSDYIPVNSVHVTQCYWDNPTFNYTLTIARPYGWVFGIPLANRCSIGYMYNKDINTLEEVMADVQNIFEEYKLKPSEITNSFSFKNYKRRSNIDGNTAFNGNASFFLEPLEATSFSTVDAINTIIDRHWFHGASLELSNQRYNDWIDANEAIIMLHYYVGSDFNTPFWDYAEERGRKCIENASPSFHYMLDNSIEPQGLGCYDKYFPEIILPSEEFQAVASSWWEGSFAQNKIGLGIT